MSSVARPRAPGNGTTRTSRRPGSQTPGRSRGRRSASPEDIRYAMDVVVQPPATARAGAPLAGAVIVRLRTTNVEPEHVVGDSSHLYAYATLVPGPNSTVTNDPRRLNTLLRGPRLDSVRSFRDAAADGSISFMEMDDPRGVGVMIFNSLEIWQAGSYRIRITLARFVTDADGREGYVNIQAVESNPILVQGASPPTRLAQNGVGDGGDDDGEWLEVLRAIQERRRSR
ncbi:uncharacterized protein EI97DRAFT_385929 [Westerdykella ornata]|uniref:Velvet domain-containing protein n=1 Tax=Westerdykella ornata TaxID=318751 RepID=A0A6A6J826_WESOR|nr:uncharacterized protein EI97DRAFT_385929 [Westerdykella ornata]KAF2272354.1 hypothetical protein EI97DRAFT_385929 [Westerdykella ornata]